MANKLDKLPMVAEHSEQFNFQDTSKITSAKRVVRKKGNRRMSFGDVIRTSEVETIAVQMASQNSEPRSASVTARPASAGMNKESSTSLQSNVTSEARLARRPSINDGSKSSLADSRRRSTITSIETLDTRRKSILASTDTVRFSIGQEDQSNQRSFTSSAASFSIFEHIPLERDGRRASRMSTPSFKFEDFIANLKKSRPSSRVGAVPIHELKERLKNTKFTGLSREELYYYIEAFCAFDIDGSGSINESELVAAMTTLNLDISVAEVHDMINKVDGDGTGDVSLEEFINLMTTLRKKKHFLDSKEQILDSLKVIDYDNDGKIGVFDLQELFFELGEPITKEVAEEMIRYSSSTFDGYCHPQDYLRLMTSMANFTAELHLEMTFEYAPVNAICDIITQKQCKLVAASDLKTAIKLQRKKCINLVKEQSEMVVYALVMLRVLLILRDGPDSIQTEEVLCTPFPALNMEVETNAQALYKDYINALPDKKYLLGDDISPDGFELQNRALGGDAHSANLLSQLFEMNGNLEATHYWIQRALELYRIEESLDASFAGIEGEEEDGYDLLFEKEPEKVYPKVTDSVLVQASAAKENANQSIPVIAKDGGYQLSRVTASAIWMSRLVLNYSLVCCIMIYGIVLQVPLGRLFQILAWALAMTKEALMKMVIHGKPWSMQRLMLYTFLFIMAILLVQAGQIFTKHIL